MKNFLRFLLLSLVGLALPAFVAAQIAPRVVRTKIAGMDVLVYPADVEEIVSITGALPAGDAFSPPENPALATLVAGMLDKGTTTHGKFELAAKLEEVGGSISFGAGAYDARFSARCLKADVPLVISLIAEQLRTPAFAADELAKFKKQLTGTLKRSLENTTSQADDAFSRAIYPAGHPNRRATTEELLAGVEAAKVEDLKAFHAAHYGPAHITLVAVGDIDPPQLQTEIQKNFNGWVGGDAPLPAAPQPATAARLDGAKEQTVFIPSKTSVNVVWGQATGLKYRDADALALRVGTAILGRGFTGRLMGNVRDKEGLTYGISSTVDDDTFTDGDWTIKATFAPTLLGKGVESTRRQLTRWYDDGVTADELARRKTELAGSYQVGLATTSGIATALLTAVQRGCDLSWVDEYPAKINALPLQQVNGVIKKYLNPEKMVLIEAGTVPGMK